MRFAAEGSPTRRRRGVGRDPSGARSGKGRGTTPSVCLSRSVPSFCRVRGGGAIVFWRLRASAGRIAAMVEVIGSAVTNARDGRGRAAGCPLRSRTSARSVSSMRLRDHPSGGDVAARAVVRPVGQSVDRRPPRHERLGAAGPLDSLPGERANDVALPVPGRRCAVRRPESTVRAHTTGPYRGNCPCRRGTQAAWPPRARRKPDHRERGPRWRA
jgi:hypothetical protein